MSEIDVKVVKISKIEPHENADRLVLAQIGDMDYRCIVKKGQFNEGDLCIYIPPDAVIPKTMVDKLQENSKITIDSRIRPTKIRGVYSEGMCLVPTEWVSPDLVKENADVKDVLGITKFEPTDTNQQSALRNIKEINPFYKNPNFVEYRCVEQYKKYPSVLEQVEGDVVATVKMHGSNFRAGYVKVPKGGGDRNWFKRMWVRLFGNKSPTEFLVGSHGSIRRPARKSGPAKEYEKTDAFWRVAIKYDIKKACDNIRASLFDNDPNVEIVIYGEVIGPGIQKGYEYGIEPGELELRVFDIMINKKFSDWDTVVKLARENNLPVVEEVFRGPWSKEVVELSKTIDSYNGKKYNREGIVVRPLKEMWHPKCGRVIMKYINPAYLLDKTNTDFH